ncbi:MAG: hypothetical protein V9E88_07210 [Ferruginibacter sp.]
MKVTDGILTLPSATLKIGSGILFTLNSKEVDFLSAFTVMLALPTALTRTDTG